MEQIKARVNSQIRLSGEIFDLRLFVGEVADHAKPGQFVSLYCKEGGRLLPRPISICDVIKETGELRLVYRIAGDGTREFSTLSGGDSVRVTGPLGNGFLIDSIEPDTHSVLFGGGIGIPPMLYLAKSLPGKKTIFLGYRDKETFLREEFLPYGNVIIATDDGSLGVKGNVLTAYQMESEKGDILFACGPKPMLRGIREFSLSSGIKAELSLEERMACGIGACLACVCKSTELDEHSMVKNKRVCKEGPVFFAEEIEL